MYKGNKLTSFIFSISDDEWVCLDGYYQSFQEAKRAMHCLDKPIDRQEVYQVTQELGYTSQCQFLHEIDNVSGLAGPVTPTNSILVAPFGNTGDQPYPVFKTLRDTLNRVYATRSFIQVNSNWYFQDLSKDVGLKLVE